MYLPMWDWSLKINDCADSVVQSEWIPFFKELIWPVFLGLVLFFWRRHIIALLNRISNFEAGGVKVQLTPPEEITTLLEIRDHPRNRV